MVTYRVVYSDGHECHEFKTDSGFEAERFYLRTMRKPTTVWLKLDKHTETETLRLRSYVR